MGAKDFADLRVYQIAEGLADEVWRIVRAWEGLARDTIGKQLIRAADRIGANIAEGTGRGTYQDNRRFVRIARRPLYETRHRLRRAHKRGLLASDQARQLKLLIDDLHPRLNAYLRSIGSLPPNDPIPPMTNDRAEGPKMTHDQ